MQINHREFELFQLWDCILLKASHVMDNKFDVFVVKIFVVALKIPRIHRVHDCKERTDGVKLHAIPVRLSVLHQL